MSEKKMSSDEVPIRFTNWLLAMGCPLENIPPTEKVFEICRGQYYMVWRSLIEHVEAKDVVKRKRLQVFHDDVLRCQKKSSYEHDSSVTIPNELILWRQQAELKRVVEDEEANVKQAQLDLNLLYDKGSNKLSRRNISRSQVQDAQRRAWMLQRLAEELQTRKTNLQETKAIADSLCCANDDTDAENKLDKYMMAPRRAAPPPVGSTSLLSVASPVACSSVVSTTSDPSDFDEYMTSLVKCRSDVLWLQLCERRARLNAALLTPNTNQSHTHRITPQSVLAHTAALHCTLALEAMKNKANISNSQKRLTAAISALSDYLTSETSELLVLKCEKAYTEGRVNALRGLLDELSSRTGVFATGDQISLDDYTVTERQLALIDKAIRSKKTDLKLLIGSLTKTERKIQNVSECLMAVFKSFHKDVITEDDKYRDQLEMPQEPISTLRQFYEDKRKARPDKLELSLDLNMSENCSFNDPTDGKNPSFVNELKIYLDKFNLEKNRKMVLESGENIWIFETLQESVQRIYQRWQEIDVTCRLFCPSVTIEHNLKTIVDKVKRKNELESTLKLMETEKKPFDFDIQSKIEEEQIISDKIKKQLNEKLLSLQRTDKTLELVLENLRLWSADQMRKYVSANRTVDGRSYKDYEKYYLENLNL